MATSAQLAKQISALDASQKSSADILNEAMGQYGVSGIQKNVQDLRTSLNNTTAALNAIPDSVTGRTSRSLVTEAQREAMVNNESAPLQQSITGIQGNLSTESANLSDAESAANTLAQGEITDQTTKRSNLEQEYQDAVNAEAAKLAAQQKAAADAEAKREFNITAAQKSSSGGSTGATVNQVAQIKAGLLSVRGKDGYVSPQDYAKAYADWIQMGGTKSSFTQMFGNLKNPKNGYYNYAISQLGL